MSHSCVWSRVKFAQTSTENQYERGKFFFQLNRNKTLKVNKAAVNISDNMKGKNNTFEEFDYIKLGEL